jgi:23S rRNA pseudouridine1911/1915/1917 synthase
VDEETPDPEFVVQAAEAGARLDVFLAKRGIVPSVAAGRRAVAAGSVRVNGRAAKKGKRLEPGDHVALSEAPAESFALVPRPDVPLALLYQDDAIIVVDKPAGLPSHPLHAGDGPSVASALVARFPECASASLDPREGGLGHRLDVPTSGVIIAARNRAVWHRLRESLGTSGCEKTYRAEVVGTFPPASVPELVLPGASPSSLVVMAPIGRQGRRGSKVRVGAGREPLPARTEIALLEAREDSSLVEARLSLGRAHQVRAHLAYLGTPVRGDMTYGSGDTDNDGDTRLRLHAWAVSLVHPTSHAPLHFESPLPDWARVHDD